MTATRKRTSVSKANQNEKPLITNQKLRHIYTKLVEARIFEEHLTKRQRRSRSAARLSSTRSQEACRVSALIDLKAGDLVSDVTMNPVTELILGAEVRPLLQRASKSTRKNQPSAVQQDNIAQQLPPVRNATERLQIAMGAALALKTANPGHIVLALINHRELQGSAWKKLLTLARTLELPIIFVVLPDSSNKKRASAALVCNKAGLTGVPGIPVDSADAIAMFRIIQESLGRTRGGDGPVLIECLKYRLSGHSAEKNDPIVQMRRFLLERKVSDQVTLDAKGKTFLHELRQSKR